MYTPPVSDNDHHTVYAILNFQVAKAKAYQRLMWDYSSADWLGLNEALDRVDWDECFATNDIDESCRWLSETLINLARQFVPNKMVMVRPNDKPFYKGYLRRLKRRKDRSHNVAKPSKTPHDWAAFRKDRNYYINELKRIKEEFECTVFEQLAFSCNKNPKKWWYLSRCLMHKKSEPYRPFLPEIKL
jgi:hypothetical protein